METLNGILIWIGANTTFVIAGIITIVILAILKGTAITKPHVKVVAIADDGSRLEVHANQPYVGPGKFRPNSASMLLGAAQTAEKLSGNNRHSLPRLEDSADYIDAE